MKKRLLLTLFASLLIAENKNINFRHITVQTDGLSESSIYNILQDSRGYMWISTDNGLNKYDGYSMKAYQYMHYDEHSISKGAPRTIFEDKSGHIWISTTEGLVNKFNVETEEFKRIDPLNINNTRIRSSTHLEQLPDGRIIGTKDLYFVVMDKDGNHLKNIPVISEPIYTNEFYDQLKEISKKENLIADINSPGNSENLTKAFTIDSEDSVYVILMGEFEVPKKGKYDWGWVEDAKSDKVWSPWEKDTTSASYAGGNRFNRITVEKIKLSPGDYKLRYSSDAIYSAALWTMAPPDHPEHWGIGIYKVSTQNKLNVQKRRNEHDLKHPVQDIEVNKEGTIWMANNEGMALFDVDTGIIDRHKTKYKYGLREIVQDPYDNNYLWCLGNDDGSTGLCRFNKATGMFKYYDIDPDKSDDFSFWPRGFEFMDEDEIWFYSNKGILRFEIKNGEVSRLVKERGNRNTLAGNNINYLYKDNASSMWVSTSTMGISIYDPYYQKFGLLPYAEGRKNSFSNPLIIYMGENHKGEIIIANGGDLYRFNPIKGQLTQDNSGFSKSFGHGQFYISDSIGHFTSWDFKNSKRVITKYDFKDEKIVKQWAYDKNNRNSIINNGVEEIHYDKRGILWVGYQNNTLTVNLKGSDIFINYNTDLSKFNGKDLSLAQFIKKVCGFIQGYTHKKIFEDSEVFMWIGSYSGILFKIDIDNYKIDTYNHDPEDPTSTPSGAIVTISEDSRNNLWLGTWPTGMCRFDKTTGKSKRYYEKEGGLIDNTVCGIIPDDDGYLWIATKNGVCKFNPVLESFEEHYYAEDGLQSNEYLFDAALKGSDGTIYFGGTYGVNYFQPEKIFTNPNPPIIDISSVYKDGKKVILGLDIETPKLIEVSYKDRGIAFDFNGLNYTRTEKNQYKYKMEGYDPDWVDAGNRRFASYTNLPPGDYTFEVTGSNNDGLWNSEPTQLGVKVYPPPWATWWAYTSYVVLLGLGIYVFVGYRERTHKREIEENRKSEELDLARQFQLDMLPKRMPDTPNFDIAAVIKTSTEVGGDYYDFFQQDDGSIYVVTGDATGHGMTAGMMVSITKAGLYGIPAIPTDQITNRLNRVIKNIELGTNRMALNVSYFKNGQVQFTSAGMPPAYHFISTTGEVKEILQVGLPLGGIQGERYSQEEHPFESGDTMVFLSDGLPEAENAAGEMLGYEAVMDCIQNNKNKDPETIKNILLDLGDNWLNGVPLQDDITIVVVKKT
jgi:serine phosphatase RsbU (regulator of sigma subunit)/ligand-binding sensor domain-containing protein